VKKYNNRLHETHCPAHELAQQHSMANAAASLILQACLTQWRLSIVSSFCRSRARSCSNPVACVHRGECCCTDRQDAARHGWRWRLQPRHGSSCSSSRARS
jgi:hypothetical protein